MVVPTPGSIVTRPCPACNETIRNLARRCKHCGEVFVRLDEQRLPPLVPRRPVPRQVTTAWKLLLGGLALVLCGGFLPPLGLLGVAMIYASPLWALHGLFRSLVQHPTSYRGALEAGGLIVLVLGSMFGLVYLAGTAADQAARRRCRHTLVSIGVAVEAYRVDHDGALPAPGDPGFLDSLDQPSLDLDCPLTDLRYRTWRSGNLPAGPPAEGDPPVPIAWDASPTDHHHVLLLDGRVEALDEEALEELLAGAADRCGLVR